MKRILTMAIVALLALGIGGAGAYFGAKMLMPPAPGPAVAAAPVVAKPAAIFPIDGVFYDLPQMLVTLNDPDNGTRVLQLSVSIECPSEFDLDKLKAYLPRVIDVFQTYGHRLTMKDLRGRQNLETLREELRQQVEAAIEPGKVSVVLFHSFGIQ